MPRNPNLGSSASPSASPRLLVIGCGSPLGGDDSVGLEIVHRLRVRGDCGCQLLELPGGPLSLLDTFDNAEVILFVDAVQSGAPPGTIHLVPLPSHQVEARSLGRVSSHGWGLDETLRLARSLGRRVPRMMLLGIELQNLTPGEPRTPSVEAALDSVVNGFPELVNLSFQPPTPHPPCRQSKPKDCS